MARSETSPDNPLPSPDVDRQKDAGRHATVAAAEVRESLGLSPHQLSELSAGLRVDVGDRPNYPRYRRDDIHRMIAVQTLRELRVPLEVALRAGVDYGPLLSAGRGWLVVAPAEDTWTLGYVATPGDLVRWVRAAEGRSSVIDLESILGSAQKTWAGLGLALADAGAAEHT